MPMPPRIRVAVGTLTISAAAATGWIASEGFSDKPIIPVQGDRPTIGHGSTFWEDGTPVKMTDGPITRQRAYSLAIGQLDKKYAKCVRDGFSPHVQMAQVEFDQAADFAGQYGCLTWNNSSMHASYELGDYEHACEGYLKYRLFHTRQRPANTYGWQLLKDGRWRFDCSLPGNKVCRGVWDRQIVRYSKCIGLQ